MKPQVCFQYTIDLLPISASGITHTSGLNVIGASIFNIDKST